MNALLVKQLSKSFGGVKAVDDCSLAVERGRITALIGPNGAGKTTIFNLISGFLAPDQGQIVFEGQDITRLAVWQRSRLGLSRTFQLSRLFRHLSIFDNLLLAARDDDDHFWRSLFRPTPSASYLAQIQTVMDLVGLKKELTTLVTDLSYGEQKLFDLGRALVNPHTFLMLDEPVAGVNPVIREQLLGLWQKLRLRGETVLLIEHDMDFVRQAADWIIVLDQGRVLTQGEPEKVLTEPAVLEAYLGAT